MMYSGDEFYDDETTSGPIDHEYARRTRYQRQRADLITRAQLLRASGSSLFTIAQTLGVTKQWLREYAGLTD